MALHSSTLAWKIPWTEEPGRPQSMESLRVGHDWATSLSLFTFMHWRGQWPPTPVFSPGESQGRGAWWAAAYGVAESRTRLQRLGSSTEVWVAGIFRTTPQAFPGPTDWQPQVLSPYRAITKRQKHLTAVKGFLPTVPQVFTQERPRSSSEPGFQRGKQACAKGEDLHPSRQRECSRCTAPRSFLSSPHTLRRRGAPGPQEGRRRRRTVVGGGKRESRDSEGTSEGASGQATRCPRLPAAPAGSRSPRAALRPTGRRRRRRTASAMLYNSQGWPFTSFTARRGAELTAFRLSRGSRVRQLPVSSPLPAHGVRGREIPHWVGRSGLLAPARAGGGPGR